MIIMEEKSRYHNDVMFSALSGLLFFWLVVQFSMKRDSNTWNEDEKLFVNSWCLIGNYLLLLLLWFFFNVIAYETFSYWIFSVFAQFFGFLILFLVLGCFNIPKITTMFFHWKNFPRIFHFIFIGIEKKGGGDFPKTWD